jgi:hypothetical protein
MPIDPERILATTLSPLSDDAMDAIADGNDLDRRALDLGEAGLHTLAGDPEALTVDRDLDAISADGDDVLHGSSLKAVIVSEAKDLFERSSFAGRSGLSH